jgi:hypothetical protein
MVKPELCPRGHYCETGKLTPDACPAGTYGPFTGRKTLKDCFTCPPGQYCLGPDALGVGKSEPDGPCDKGFLCAGSD